MTTPRRCPRCGGNLLASWEDDIAHPRCLQCGRRFVADSPITDGARMSLPERPNVTLLRP